MATREDGFWLVDLDGRLLDVCMIAAHARYVRDHDGMPIDVATFDRLSAGDGEWSVASSFAPDCPPARKTIDLDKLLDWITSEVYNYGHGVLPGSSFVVDAEGLLDHLRDQTGIATEEMTARFDAARVRVHGESAKAN